MTGITDIIVPVYAGVEETRRCLESVVASTQRTPWQLIIIDDASPDPEMAPMLEHFAASHEHVELHHNPKNLGFVATVNRGMRLHPDRNMVLLNSDTQVANDWLDRLCRAANASPRVATVTPFSNNATICSFPRFCEYNPLPAGWSMEALDALIARVNEGKVVEIPTGVGFCMFIRREALNEVGLFDEARFGRGYGEENDFCRRAAKAGWKNLLCCDTFVWHEGGVSFSDEQAERIERAQRILDRLHPDYHGLVQQHIQADPAAVHRFRTLVEMYRSSPRQKVLHITHHLGGGTLKHVQELSRFLENEMDSLRLQPEGEGCVSLHFGTAADAPSLAFQLPGEYPALRKLLGHLRLSRIHFHHTLGLETSVWGLPRELGLPFDVTLHDYYFINAHPTQTDAKGRYQPDLTKQSSSYPLPVPLDEWQRAQRRLLDQAERIIAPSEAAAQELSKHFSGLRITVALHPDSEAHMPWPDVRSSHPPGEPLRILALGALSPEKGADILEATAREAQRTGAPLEFHLLGYAYRPLDDCVICHGAYSEQTLFERIREIDPHLVWFTALWPETYSYTLSEALLAGLPIVAPDLGAFEERLAGRPLTWVEPWDQSPARRVTFFTHLMDPLDDARGQALAWTPQPRSGEHAAFYRNLYLSPQARAADEPMDPESLERLLKQALSLDRSLHRPRREALLRHLLTLRQHPLGRLVARVIPIQIQRRIKRTLARRPLHEIE